MNDIFTKTSKILLILMFVIGLSMMFWGENGITERAMTAVVGAALVSLSISMSAAYIGWVIPLKKKIRELQKRIASNHV